MYSDKLQSLSDALVVCILAGLHKGRSRENQRETLGFLLEQNHVATDGETDVP